MKMLEKILVATDFGNGSNDAVKTALSVAKSFRSDVVLLHVVPSTLAVFCHHRRDYNADCSAIAADRR